MLSRTLLTVLTLFTASLSAVPFWRTFYEEDRRTQTPEKLRLLETAYGAKLFLYSWEDDAEAPKQPKHVEGVVVHDDPSDDGEPLWVVGDENPTVDFQRVKAKYTGKFGDISDKWVEYHFLKATVPPSMVPPEMHLACEFSTGLESDLPEITEKAKAAVKTLGIAKTFEVDLIQLELVRRRIQKQLGKAILKNRLLNHSEGTSLPKTKADWIDLYAHYAQQSQEKIHKLLKDIAAGRKGGFAEHLLETPYAAGYALETLLDNMKAISQGNQKLEECEIVVQKMISLRREVRVHIVNGRIIEGATFLRFYHLNEYLPKEDKDRIEGTLRDKFLAALPKEERDSLCATPDMVIDQTSGSVRFLDFNDGIESGYYYPEEDLFTTNLLAKHLSGESTRFLDEFKSFTDLDPVDDAGLRLASLKSLLKKYRSFMQGDVLEAFWDRVQRDYLDRIARARGERREAILLAGLSQFEAAGLEQPTIYLQFLAEAFGTSKALAADLSEWKPKLEQMAQAKGLEISIVKTDRGRLEGIETEITNAKRQDSKWMVQNKAVEKRSAQKKKKVKG